MNWNILQGNWKQWAGRACTRWGELTGDDLRQIAGRRQQMAGKRQRLSGMAVRVSGVRDGAVRVPVSCANAVSPAASPGANLGANLGVLPAAPRCTVTAIRARLE